YVDRNRKRGKCIGHRQRRDERKLCALANWPAGAEEKCRCKISGWRIPGAAAPPPARRLHVCLNPNRSVLAPLRQPPRLFVRGIDGGEMEAAIAVGPLGSCSHRRSVAAAVLALSISGAGRKKKRMEKTVAAPMISESPPPTRRSNGFAGSSKYITLTMRR